MSLDHAVIFAEIAQRDLCSIGHIFSYGVFSLSFCYRQDAAKRQPAGIVFYSVAKNQHFAP